MNRFVSLTAEPEFRRDGKIVSGVILTNATLVDFDPPQVRSGALRVEDGKIARVDATLRPQDGDDVVDCHGAVVLPGLVNGHTHLYSALAAGMPAPRKTPRSFHEILQFIWWRLDRAHNEASVRASGQVGAIGALRCGTTTLIDHHASPSFIDGSLTALRDGIDEIGCRGLLCYEVTDRNGLEGARWGIDENERFVAECRSKPQSRFAGIVGAHASFTLGEESLAQCVALCQHLNTGLHIHVAEDPVDERLTREQWGCGLIERFQRHGVLDLSHSIFAHGTHLNSTDIETVNAKAESVTLAHNPSSNMNNGVGYTPVAEYRQRPMLGTDGIGADLWREARTAQFKSHDAHRPLPLCAALEMLAQSARFASEALGCRLGVLAEGAAADLVLTRYRPATPLSADNLAGHLIFAMGPEYVASVMVDGSWRMREGELVGCDEAAIRSAAQIEAAALYGRMAE
jgi:putative selenium metabolism protein SsnA